MAIITALELAKTYLSFSNLTNTDVETRVANALVPATLQFESDYKRYLKNKYIGDTFNSVSVEDLGDDKVKVELSHAIIRKLYYGYDLEVESGSYADRYKISAIDTVNNTIIIDAVFSDEEITFSNRERQIYEGALAWYICAFTRFTLQEIKACTYMASSSQLGDGSTTNFSVDSLERFRAIMMENAKKILNPKRFPNPL